MSLDGEARLLLVAPAEAGTAGNVAQGRRWPPSSRGRRSLRRVLVRPPRAPALLYHGARRAAAVVAPAGFAPDIAQLVPPRRSPYILRDPDPFVDRGPQYVEAAELLDDAVSYRVVVAFGDEAADHLVPDAEDPAVLGTQVARIAPRKNGR